MEKYRRVKESSIKKLHGKSSMNFVVGYRNQKSDEQIYEQVYKEMAEKFAERLVTFFKFEIKRPRPGRIEWDASIEIIVPETPASMKAKAAAAKVARAKAVKENGV